MNHIVGSSNKTMTVDECCESIYSGGTPSTKNPAYWNGNLPWLSSGETRARFIIDTEKTITELGVAESSTKQAKAGDVVMASAAKDLHDAKHQCSSLTPTSISPLWLCDQNETMGHICCLC